MQFDAPRRFNICEDVIIALSVYHIFVNERVKAAGDVRAETGDDARIDSYVAVVFRFAAVDVKAEIFDFARRAPFYKNFAVISLCGKIKQINSGRSFPVKSARVVFISVIKCGMVFV